MKAIIIDDEQQARISLRLLLEEFCPEIELADECENLPRGVKSIRKNKPDLVFLDIEMPGHSGLELLDFFDEDEIDFGIIFTTAYSKYAVDVFKFSAIDYLLKPISPEKLSESVQRYEKKKNKYYKTLGEAFKPQNFNKIAVPSGSQLILLNTDEISFIKGERAYSEIFMNDGRKILVSRNLKKFEELFENFPSFLRIHKSYIVNFEQILSFTKSDGGWVKLKSGTDIPVSPERAALLLEKVTSFKR